MTFLFLLVYFAIIIAVIEIHVILFQLTGLKAKISRFQVISMMTGTGFTTGESEHILSHPIRRRLGIFLILFGAFSLAVIITAISSLIEDELRTKQILYLAGFLIFLFGMLKTRLLQNFLSKKFKDKNQDGKDVKEEDQQVYEIQIKSESSVNNITTKQLSIDKDSIGFMILINKMDEEKVERHNKS